MEDYFKNYAEIANYISHFNTENINVLWVKHVTKDIPHKWDVHTHDCHEFMYHLGGKGTVKLTDGQLHKNNLAVIASDLIYIPPGIAHEGLSDLQWSEEMVVVHFIMPVSYHFQTYIKIKCANDAYPWLFRQVAAEYNNKNEHYQQLINNYLANIILMLKRDFMMNADMKKDIISWSIQYMHDHISDKISIKELAASVHMSESSFSKFFTKKTGTSPLHYFNLLKIDLAKQQLINKTQPINEIAEKLGYTDPFYFSRIFSKVVGISPRQFRKNYYS
ncbi:MAG TPA: hypothetical protein DD738_04900 [Ruminiclostridium sp.]|nr:hypothetical protein [Ruminiclostridium sp.]